MHHLAALQGSLPQPQISGQGTLEHQRALIQLATCHFALGEYRVSPGCPTGVGTLLGALGDPGPSSLCQSGFLIPCIFPWNLLFLPRFYYLICWWKRIVILFYLISYFPSRTWSQEMGIEEWQHLILSSLLAPPLNWLSVYLRRFKVLTAQLPMELVTKLEPHDPVAMGGSGRAGIPAPQPRWLARAWAAEPRGHLVPALSSLTSIFWTCQDTKKAGKQGFKIALPRL